MSETITPTRPAHTTTPVAPVVNQENALLLFNETVNGSPALSKVFNNKPIPGTLFHGSAFKQTELKPGYQHTKKIVNWDKYESNIYLYATSDMKAGKLLGISSAWEKKYELKETHFDQSAQTIRLVFDGVAPSREELMSITAYIYAIKYVPGVWQRNNNPFNNIDNEYKTQKTVTDIISCDQIDVKEVLADFTISIS